MQRLRLLGWWICALALLAGWSRPAMAQEQTIDWQVEPGFAGAYRSNIWFPVTITVANRGPDLRGTFEVRLPFGAPQAWSYAIDLPHNANKRVTIPVLDTAHRSGVVTAELVFRVDERVVKRERVRLNALETQQLVLGVVSDDATALPELSTLEHPQRFGATHVTRLTPASLPEQPAFLEMFDVVFLHRFEPERLSPAQRDALRAWVAGGGQLVLGGDARLVQGLDALAPATTTGATQTVPARALEVVSGWRARANAAALQVLRVEPRSDATVLIAADGTPVLVRRPLGLGTVTLATFDLAALADVGDAAGFWARVLVLTTGGPLGAQAREQGFWLLQQALNLPALRLPSAAAILGFLLLYVAAVGPLNYLVLRRMDRREWAYLTVPLLVLIFSSSAYAWGRIGRGGQPLMTQIALVRAGSAGQQAQALSLVTLFSPGRATYDLAFARDALVSDLAPEWIETDGPADVLYAEDATRVPEVLVDVGGIRAFAVEQTVTPPPLEVVWRADDQVTLRNRGDRAIEDVTLVRGNGMQQTIGTLEAGAERTLALDLAPPMDQGDADADRPVINRARVLEQWKHLLIDQRTVLPLNIEPNPSERPAPWLAAQPDPSRQLYVFGWQSGALGDVRLNGAPPSIESQALFVWAAQKEE